MWRRVGGSERKEEDPVYADADADADGDGVDLTSAECVVRSENESLILEVRLYRPFL